MTDRSAYPSTFLACFLVSAIALLTTAAHAFDDPPASLGQQTDVARLRRFHLNVEGALYVGGPVGYKAWSVSPLVGLRFHFNANWLMEAKWGLAQVHLKQENGGESSNGVRSGNPFVAVHYQGQTSRYSYRVGLGATAPAATLPSDLNDQRTVQAAFTYAAAMRGSWDFWLWNPHNISIVLPARFQRRWAEDWTWGVEMAIAAMISIDDKNDGNHALVQAAGDLGYRALSWLEIGSRLSLVVIPKFSNQQTQLAVEPFLRFGSDRAYGTLRLLMNIDNPSGFAFDKHGVWALRAGGGVAF